MKNNYYRSMIFFGMVLLLAAGCADHHPAPAAEVKAPVQQLYRCPMHHDIVRDKPGSCPICGMDLVAFSSRESAVTEVNLNTLLKPANSYVISTLPVVSVQQSEAPVTTEALGTIRYDTRQIGVISARVSGRIEKLYLKYTFHDVHRGQKVMDIYSPELVTAQQDLLFLLKSDAANTSLINAAKEKLLLLGMDSRQLQQVIQAQQPVMAVSIYSNYDGHLHDALNMPATVSMAPEPLVTRDLQLKEGMYVQKGQTLLTVLNPHRLWVVLDIYADNQGLVKVGDPVHIVSEAMPDMDFNATIDFIEPFFREGSKTLTARVYFENHAMNMPVGSQVKATISARPVKAGWLPKDAVISLGIDKIVFKKYDAVFKAHKVETGISFDNKIQIISGLTAADTVAANAQFLMDSESFIKVNE